MERKPGHYLGTEIDETWWKRYRQDGFFARGNGHYWFEDKAFRFLRTLTSKPIAIPYERMRSFKVSTWHAGRWSMGQPIVKILWNRDGRDLSSGFVLSKTPAEAQAVIGELEKRAAHTEV